VVVLVSAEAIRSLVEPQLTAAGLELWDVEIGRDVLRILVDRPGGVDLDSLASLTTRVVSPLLDERPDLTPGGRYQLEVSSPGAERRLRTLDQYRRYIGTDVSVKTKTPVAGARRHQGQLVAVDEHGVRVAVEGGDIVEIAHDQIERTRTVLVWGPPPRRPSPSRGAARAKTAAHTKDAGS
jgi:ribosome maturation factor RimP